MIGNMTPDSRQKLYGIAPIHSVVDRISVAASAKHYFQDPQWRELSRELQSIDFKAKGTPLFITAGQIIKCLEAGVCVDRGDGKIVFTNQYTATNIECMPAFDYFNVDVINCQQQAETMTIEQGDVFEETTAGYFLNVTKYPMIIDRVRVNRGKQYRELTKYVPDVPMD